MASRQLPASIIVLTYNTCEMTVRCLDRFAENALAAGWQLIVVDNGSTDGTAQAIAQAFPAVELVYSEQNLGFAGGNNLGLRQVIHDVIFLLNSDVIAEQSTLSFLSDYLLCHSAVGAVSPRLLAPAGTPQAFAFGAEPTLWYLLRRGSRRLMGLGPVHDWNTERPVDVDWVSAACLAVRRAAYAQVGGLDDSFFLYFEDVDWCLRLRRNGWRVVYNPDVSVVHLGGASQPQRGVADRLYQDSLRYFYRKHYGAAANIVLRISLSIYNSLLRLTTHNKLVR